jgi:sensor histidine kinase YesM
MNIFHRPLIICLVAVSLITIAQAQAPTPIIVQAANAPATAATSTSSKAAAAATDAQSIPGAIKLLEQIKAANDEVLAKQKAALEKLSEMQEAADQLQIFAKRG